MSNFRILGDGLKVSALGLGCMGMSHAYGKPSDAREMTRLLCDAVDMGYTFFDTAEIYGTTEDPHHNERIIGKALRHCRDNIVLATKFGLTFDDPYSPGPHPIIPDSTPETIRKSVEGSLSRLQTDHIDLYYQHRIDPAVEPETVAETMASLIREGKTRYPVADISRVDALQEPLDSTHPRHAPSGAPERESRRCRHTPHTLGNRGHRPCSRHNADERRVRRL